MSNAGDRITQLLDEFRHSRDVMAAELGKVIIGQREVIEQILAAIFTRGHVLLVGVPGLAKTLMVSSIAQILDVGFKRIQFTPDLMPSDITGTNVLEEPEAGRRAFRFVQGPIFANIILADEINRTPPKTQAALLQAMQEREVTVGQETLQPARPLLRHRHAEPDRAGRDLSPARGAARPVHVRHPGRLPDLDEEEKILSTTTRGEVAELKKVLSAQGDHQPAEARRHRSPSPITPSSTWRGWSARPGRSTSTRRSSSRSWSTRARALAPART